LDELAPQPRLGPAACFRQLLDSVRQPTVGGNPVDSQAVEEGREEARLLLQESDPEVLRRDVGVAAPLGVPLGGDQRFLEALGEAFEARHERAKLAVHEVLRPVENSPSF
jgi:hypothetical protein